MRIALGLEYDGSAFNGWQRQKGQQRTVQACVEQALSRVADHDVKVITAGRTDTGVHACGQVVHFDSDSARSRHGWVKGTNTGLPADVVALWAQPTEPDFHARYSAIGRRYRYYIYTRPLRPTYLRGRVSWEHRPLAVDRMQQAALGLVGEHDFSAYRAVSCQSKSPVRELRKLHVQQQGPLIRIEAEANGFLHHMVRNLVGVLVTIGADEREPEWAVSVLESKDRTQGGVTAPPDGLYLAAVSYPERYGLDKTTEPCGFW